MIRLVVSNFKSFMSLSVLDQIPGPLSAQKIICDTSLRLIWMRCCFSRLKKSSILPHEPSRMGLMVLIFFPFSSNWLMDSSLGSTQSEWNPCRFWQFFRLPRFVRRSRKRPPSTQTRMLIPGFCQASSAWQSTLTVSNLKEDLCLHKFYDNLNPIS